MKKKLAVLLAATMALSMVPTSAFAASSNKATTASKVVKKEATKREMGYLVLEVKDTSNTDFISLTLDNAKWEDDTYTGTDFVGFGTGYTDAANSAVYTKVNDTMMYVNLNSGSALTTGFYKIPLYVEAGATAGDMKVTVNSFDTSVTSGTYTFGIAAGGATVTTAGTVKDITVGSQATLDTLVIEETTIGSKTINDLKLVAPAGFNWVITPLTLKGNSGYAGTQTVTPVWDTYTSGGVVKNDQEVIKLTFSDFGPSTAARGALTITGLTLAAETDAPTGNVDVTISGDVTEQTVTLAKCVDYGYTITAASAKSLVSGEYTAAGYETAKVTIKEDTANSWWANRATTFEFPEGVHIVSATQKTQENLGGTAAWAFNTDRNKATLTGITSVAGSKAKYEVVFYVLLAADFDGEVVCTVGNSVDDTPVTVANTVTPITAKFDTTNVGIALQDVKTSDITIVENKKGALLKGENLVLELEDSRMDFERITDIDFEVTEGNVEISKAYAKNGVVTVEIKRASTTASTIVLKGLSITLDRTPAEGDYSLLASGTAIIATGNAAIFTDVTDIEFKNYVNVTTAAPDKSASTTNKVAVTIGSTTYTVNGVEKSLEVAPVINNDRTLVPTRAISEGLGYQVLWNATTNTATIVAPDNRTAAFTLGSNVVTINGVAGLTMDAAPVVVDGRMLVPFRALGDALGINVTWDATTNTATFN